MATYGTSNQYINYSVDSQELSYDINSNTSVVRVWINVWRTNTGYTTYGSGTVYARINGGVYSAGISSSQKITSTPIRLGTWDVTVGHNDDGSKTISVSGWISHDRFSSGEQGYQHTLTTIPRASDATLTYSGYIGDNLTVSISRKSTVFTHEIYHDFLAGQWTQVAVNIATSYTFNTPLSWLSRMPNATSSSGRVLVRTKNGGTIVGDKIYNFNATAKNDIVPSFSSIKIDKINAFNDLLLQNKSSVKITALNAVGIYGSTIKNYSINGGKYSYSGNQNNYTTDIIAETGSIEFTVIVTDSRNRTAKKTITINVVEYTSPTLTLEVYRCLANGTKDYVDGNYINIKPVFTFANVTGNDISTRYIKIDNVVKNTTFLSNKNYIYGTYSLDHEHVVEVGIEDKAGTKIEPIRFTVGVAIIPYNIPLHKNGIGFGRLCDKEDQMQVGYDINIIGKKLLIDGMEQPVFTLVETVDVEI